MITLQWANSRGEGYLQIRDSFKNAGKCVQLDALKDWIEFLELEYDKLLAHGLYDDSYPEGRKCT